MSNFNGKVAIITGSCAGVGAATAKLFAKKGCNLSLTGRNEENLKKVQQECIHAGLKADQVIYFVGEITDEKFLKRLVDGTIEKFGKLDILINNAGTAVLCSVSDAETDDFEHVLNVNVRSVISLTELCVPHLIKTKGAIVNNANITAKEGENDFAYYCLPKDVLDMSMKRLALEVASDGVRVNAVHPGFIDSPIIETILDSPEKVESLKEVSAESFLMETPQQPEEIAEAFALMASDSTPFATGQMLFVEGGYTLNFVDIPN